MPTWIDGLRARCGPLSDAASILAAQWGVERDPPAGVDGLLALIRALRAHRADARASEDDERLLVELAGAYLAVVLCERLGGTHAKQDARHGLRLGSKGFFDPFAAVESALVADDVRTALCAAVAEAEAEARDQGPVARAALEAERQQRASEQWPEARMTVFPRLVGAALLRELAAASQKHALCTVRLADGLRAAFVLRTETRARYVHEGDLRVWQCEPAQVYAAALANLARASEGARVLRADGDEGAFVVARSGDGLDSSRVLLPGLQALIARELGGPFAVAVPHRDALFACALQPGDGVSALRARAQLEAQRARYAISAELFAVHPGGELVALPAR